MPRCPWDSASASRATSAARPTVPTVMMTAVITRSRPAPTDTTTTILMLARRTDITAHSGLTAASSWESARGTDGVGAVAADTGATIGADAAGVTMVTVATDIVAGTDTAVAMVTAGTAITVDMAAAGMATTADITAAGRIRVVDIAGAVDTMAVVTPSVVAAEASTAEQAGSTVEAVASMVEAAADSTAVVEADSTAVVEAADSMVAVADMAADIDSPQIGFTLGSFYKSAAVSSVLAAASFWGKWLWRSQSLIVVDEHTLQGMRAAWRDPYEIV